MYIALKWLFGMVFVMWITLCSIDLYVKNMHNIKQFTDFNEQNDLMTSLLKNSSILMHRNSSEKTEMKIHAIYINNILLQCTAFIAGAFSVIIYYRKNDLISYSGLKLKTINKHEIRKNILIKVKALKNTANLISVAIFKIVGTTTNILKHFITCIITKYTRQTTSKCTVKNVNLLLLNKLREYSQERRNFEEVLFAAIQENKSIRMRSQLETLAKRRLAKHIEETQREINENRCRYMSFYQLYIITNQENSFLKSRLKKLAHDKEDAERNLIKLVNYVWQSKNHDLKAYCNRLIVETKNNLLNCDARVEIDKFCKQSYKSKQALSVHEPNKSRSLDTINELSENIHEEESIALVKDAPKLRGLPGECIWTVKDRDGFIAKLYEYETDFDNGDIIRRLRQYSVYRDNNYILDVSSATTNIDMTSLRNQYICICGSQVFQKFLEDNKISIPRMSSLQPALTY